MVHICVNRTVHDMRDMNVMLCYIPYLNEMYDLYSS